MRCGKLRYKKFSLHLLWCADCRRYRRSDELIRRGIQAYRESLPVLRPMGFRAVRLALVCAVVAILAIATFAPRQKGWGPQPKMVADTQPTHANGHDSTTRQQTPPIPDKNERPNEGIDKPKSPTRVANHDPEGTAKWQPPKVQDDLDYLNRNRTDLAGLWNTQPEAMQSLAVILGRPLPAMRDDFVEAPQTLIASAGNPEDTRRLARQLYAEYQKEAAISDARLAKNVAFKSKNDSLREVCDSLAKQTGIDIRAGRGVGDDNVTLLIKSKPAREVMRAITKLFGYTWARSGNEGQYKYVLEQDSSVITREQKIRNEDIANAVARILEATKLPTDAKGTEAIVKRAFMGLTVTELQALRNGDEVEFSSKPGAARQLEPAAAVELMDSMGRFKETGGGTYIHTGFDGMAASQLPGNWASITFKLATGELGGAKATATAMLGFNGRDALDSSGRSIAIATPITLAEVPGAGEADPKNGALNADLAKVKALQGQSTVNPPSKALYVPKEIVEPEQWTDMDNLGGWRGAFLPPDKFATTADIWLSIHETTGVDVISDSYSRLFAVTSRSGPIHQLLNEFADTMGERWRYEDGIVYARSTTYAWQRLNEPPKSVVSKVVAERQKGPLSLATLITISQLSDRQLDSFNVGRTMYHYYEVPEWGLISRPWMLSYRDKGYAYRRMMRSLSPIPAGSLDMLQRQPMGIEGLPNETVESLLEATGPWKEAPKGIAVDYIPVDALYWKPKGQPTGAPGLGIWATTAADLKAKIEKAGLAPDGGIIVKTRGHLMIMFFDAQGHCNRLAGDTGGLIMVPRQDK